MFMEIAIGAIGIGIVLMVGYLIIAQVYSSVSPANIYATYPNSCYGHLNNDTTYCNTTAVHCGPTTQNTTQYITCANEGLTSGLTSAQTTIFAGFGLVAVGIIVLAAFSLVKVFQ